LLAAAPLWRAVGHHVDPTQQVIQRTRDRDADSLHLLATGRLGGEHRMTTFDRHTESIVRDHVGDTYELKVVLQRHGVGDPLPDHAVAVHGDSHLRVGMLSTSPLTVMNAVAAGVAGAPTFGPLRLPENAPSMLRSR
jgi:hypothetical protein